MTNKSFLAALALGLATSTSAFAQTEIQWWHAMTGANNDVVNKLAEDFNASQKDYKVVASYKGQYADTMNAGIAAFRAGNAPHILQVVRSRHRHHDGRQGRGQAGLRDDEGSGREVRPQGLPARHHRLLLDRQGRDAVLPVQLVLDGHVDQQGRAQEGGRRPRSPKTWPEVFEAAKKLKAAGHSTCGFSNAWAPWAHHRAVLGLAQPADGHQGERPRRLRHRDEVQLAAACQSPADAGRPAEGQDLRLFGPRQPLGGPLHLRRMRRSS